MNKDQFAYLNIENNELRIANASLTAKLAEAEKRIEQEHELYLSAHRDNMKAALRINELTGKLKRAEDGMHTNVYELIRVRKELTQANARIEAMSKVHDALALTAPVALNKELAEAEAEIERYRLTLDVCEGAIRDAIALEDGLDGKAGEAVLRMIGKNLENSPRSHALASAKMDAVMEFAEKISTKRIEGPMDGIQNDKHYAMADGWNDAMRYVESQLDSIFAGLKRGRGEWQD